MHTFLVCSLSISIALILFSFSTASSAAKFTLVLEPEGASTQSATATAQIEPPEADHPVEPSIGSQTKTIDIDIVCNFFGAALPNCNITLNPPTVAAPNTGGHNHSDSGRPLGSFSPTQGNTGSDAIFTTTYTAPEASGVIRGSGTGFHPDFGFFSGNFTIGVMVGGLAELRPSADYDLVGQKTIHPVNHYGTASFIASLRQAAQAYAQAFTGNKLAYNDISLQFGGLFDFKTAWTTPHKSHRLGTNVDLRLVPPSHRRNLRQMVYEAGISKILMEEDPPHWHLSQ